MQEIDVKALADLDVSEIIDNIDVNLQQQMVEQIEAMIAQGSTPAAAFEAVFELHKKGRH